MRNIQAIFRRETYSFFHSNFAWIIFAVASFFNCVFFLFYLGGSQVNYIEAVRDLYYVYHGTMMIPCLVAAMYTFSAEKSEGTIELLYTSPLTDLQIVLGKFLFGVVFVLANLIILNLFFPVLLVTVWNTPINEILVGNTGLFLLGLSSFAVGLFSSSLTRNPFIALIISLMIVGPLSVVGSISNLFPNPLKDILEYVSIYFHYIKFTAGVIAVKNVVYFSSLIFLFLFLTVRVIESRRWK